MPVFINGVELYPNQVLSIDENRELIGVGEFLTEKIATVINEDASSTEILLSRQSIKYLGWEKGEINKYEDFGTAEIDCSQYLRELYFNKLKKISSDVPKVGKIMRIRRGKNKNFVGEVVSLFNTRDSKISVKIMTEQGETRFTSSKNLEFICEAQPSQFRIGDFVKVRWVHPFKGRIGAVYSCTVYKDFCSYLLKFADGTTRWFYSHEIDTSSEVHVRGLLGS